MNNKLSCWLCVPQTRSSFLALRKAGLPLLFLLSVIVLWLFCGVLPRVYADPAPRAGSEQPVAGGARLVEPVIWSHAVVSQTAAAGDDGPLDLSWSAHDAYNTFSVAWGDYDGDGDLDLAVGNRWQPNYLYRNDGGVLMTYPVWASEEADNTHSLAWGDYDNDGDLDLAVGNGDHLEYTGEGVDEPNRLYRNDDGTLTTAAVWSSDETEYTTSVAWGDVDGDGDLDLAVGNGGIPGGTNRLYHNVSGTLTASAVWSSDEVEDTWSIAWGDYDNDGDLDLAVGNFRGGGSSGQPNRLYRNDDGTLTASSVYTTAETDGTWSVAWGDYDGDGDLDLAVGNLLAQPNRLYRNDSGTLTASAVYSTTESDYTRSVAWGDYDGDGDLDLAVGNDSGPLRLYRNDDGTLTAGAVWSADNVEATYSVAWGDVDGDGDLDLAVGNWAAPNRLYRNYGESLAASAVYSTAETYDTRSVAWGDYDNDGDLDLAVGNDRGQPNLLYRNDGAVDHWLSLTWSSVETDTTTSLAWGDVDGDGDLDLAVGNGDHYDEACACDVGEPNQLYRNDGVAGGAPHMALAWSSVESDTTTSVAWGDYDGDGDLDLAVGNGGEYPAQPNRLYRNDGGTLTTSAIWSSVEADLTTSVAWGDVDNDGDLDLAVGNGCVWRFNYMFCYSNRLYRNDGGALMAAAAWSSDEADSTTSVAWGDVDGDGDLDLAAGNEFGPLRLHRNDGGMLTTSAVWSSVAADETIGVAWGDYDGDGDLDLAVGNTGWPTGQPNRLYRNDGGALTPRPAWSSNEGDITQSIAWGDYDGDGDLDLAVGNGCMTQEPYTCYPNRLYLNVRDGRENPQSVPIVQVARPGPDADFYSAPEIWTGPTIPITYALSDPQGDLVCSVRATYSPDGGGHWLPAVATNTITTNITTHPFCSGLEDAVGYWPFEEGGGATAFDASGHGYNLYLNAPVYSTVTPPVLTDSAYALDFDGIDDETWHDSTPLIDNLQDMTIALWVRPDTIPNPGIARFVTLGNSKAVLRMNDGDLHFYMSVEGSLRHIYSSGVLTTGVYQHIAGTYDSTGDVMRLYHDGVEVGSLVVTGTVDPGDGVLLGSAGEPYDGLMDDVRIYPRALSPAEIHALSRNQYSFTCTHVYTWDVYASGFFGQSDNVVFRIQAVPAIVNRPDAIPGPYLYGGYVTQTFPFRVRGSQVRVVSGTMPISNAIVYRLPKDQLTGGALIASGDGMPFHTDGQGYLQGQGQLDVGDRLMALLPITWTESYTLYYTGGAPTETGVDAYTVTTAGVQTLTVSTAHPLILFNLDVSLEWDAHNDSAYLEQLQFNLQRASEYLYDFTNGQMALGRVNVYQNADDWAYVHVTVRANNRLRPYAVQGGIVPTTTVDPQHEDIIYTPGQVSIGATWNRYGRPGQSLGEDWPLILAHELSHYLLYHDDVYLGLDGDGHLIAVDTCKESAMGDLYNDPTATEFIYDEGYWQANCHDTLAEQTLGRNEWETMQLWYPALVSPPPTNTGPGLMPFGLTKVQVFAPLTPTNTLEDPTFYLNYEGGGVSSSEARAYLLVPPVTTGGSEGGYQYVYDLGSPFGGQNRVLAHGARPGDRLCVFDRPLSQYGCEVIAVGDDQVQMERDVAWDPLVQLTPVSSTTLGVQVESVLAGLTVQARLYPEYGVGTDAITLTQTGSVYSGTFHLADPALSGHVQVWVEETATEEDPRRETLVAYSINGNPGFTRGGGGFTRGGGGFTRGGGGFTRGGGGFTRGGGAPLMSPDGQMIFFTENPLVFEVGQFYTIQGMAGLPPTPPGRTVIGQGYRLAATAGTPVVTGSVSIQYLSNDVLVAGADENGLTIYFHDGSAWQELPTTRNLYFNLVTAPSQGVGVYALMSSTRVPLRAAGWNLFAYPLQAAQPVSAALRSIDGYYRTVYGYRAEDADDPWEVYQVGGPGYVNGLHELEPGRGYWISATQAITIHLSDAPGALVTADGLPASPPDTYYGAVQGNGTFTPAVGMAVEAWIGGVLCGQGVTRDYGGQVVYVVDVEADDETGRHAGCGRLGRRITFVVDGRRMMPVGVWDNGQLDEVTLTPANVVYLPLVLKNSP